jgi:hypothetical protein
VIAHGWITEMAVRLDDVREGLKIRARDVCVYLLPNGKLVGGEWCVGSIAGEIGESLKVNVATGIWKDFASTDKGGDLLDLWQRVKFGGSGEDLAIAMLDAADFLGIGDGRSGIRRKAAAKTKRTSARKTVVTKSTVAPLTVLDGGVAANRPTSGDPFPRAHPKHGIPSQPPWVYRDAAGAPVFAVYRFDRGGGRKEFAQYTLDPEGWTGDGGKLPDPRPLYRLEELERRPYDPLIICEGEKAADAVATAGYLATTTAGGSSAPHKTDFSPLAGRSVILWGDNDDAGNQYVDKVAELLRDLDGAADIRRVQVPKDFADKGDAADVERERRHELIASARPMLDPNSVAAMGFTGAELLGLLDRPAPAPIEPGIAAPGHFNLYVGASFSGKTTLLLWLAMARAAGLQPWYGAPVFESGRVLIYSLDEAPEQVMRRIQGLAAYHSGAADLEAIARNLVVIGPDREVNSDRLDKLRFDPQGLALCRRHLLDARDDGRRLASFTLTRTPTSSQSASKRTRTRRDRGSGSLSNG